MEQSSFVCLLLHSLTEKENSGRNGEGEIEKEGRAKGERREGRGEGRLRKMHIT